MRIRHLATLAFVLLFQTGCSDPTPSSPRHAIAPALNLAQLDGSAITLPTRDADTPLLLLFWADWCPPCLAELNAINQHYPHDTHEKLRIITINIAQPEPIVRQLIERLQLKLPVYLDSHGDIAQAYGIKTLPASILINQEGKIARRISGQLTPEALQDLTRTPS
ncbi:MAG: TlpA family protein disulfide reductase [Gammaproteobacteria bacterium]|nr:TlpA family protein disulfide reductase [Gammaproteobacteria bacterium]